MFVSGPFLVLKNRVVERVVEYKFQNYKLIAYLKLSEVGLRNNHHVIKIIFGTTFFFRRSMR